MQPKPEPNNTQPIHEQVIEDIKLRAEAGKQNYGTYLQVNNGRDSLLDAYEEAQDKALYLKQAILERDTLRAELAAANNLLARIHRDGGHHTEAVGFAQSVADAGDKVSEWLLAAEERTALAAHVERLERALKQISGPLSAPDADGLIEDATCTYCDMSSLDGCDGDCPREIAAEALAATPTQFIAAHDAAVKVAVLRDVAKLMDPDGGCYEALTDEADRIAKEAGNG